MVGMVGMYTSETYMMPHALYIVPVHGAYRATMQKPPPSPPNGHQTRMNGGFARGGVVVGMPTTGPMAQRNVETMGEKAQLTEDQEQARLVAYLRRRGWLFTATANGVGTSPIQRSQMAALGVQRGVPDVLVFEAAQGMAGIAIELKRASGGTVSPEQRRWVAWLTARGWLSFVAHGADEAIRRIEEVYGPEETEG